MKKENLKKLRGMLCTLALISTPLSLTSCRSKNEHTIKKILENEEYQKERVGFIKSNDNYILYYYDQNFRSKEDAYYNTSTMKLIGIKKDFFVEDKKYSMIETKDGSYFCPTQVIPYKECFQNDDYNYETITMFDDEIIKKLEKLYFENHMFPEDIIHLYEIKNLETNEIDNRIGMQLPKKKLFNYETYQVEDLEKYEITELELKKEKQAYYYFEILDILEWTKKENRIYERK